MNYLKSFTALSLVLGLGACSTNETKEEFICLDYEIIPLIVEECTPLYGNIICIEKEKTKVMCVQKQSVLVIEEKDNG